jgi:hypothetical protein
MQANCVNGLTRPPPTARRDVRCVNPHLSRSRQRSPAATRSCRNDQQRRAFASRATQFHSASLRTSIPCLRTTQLGSRLKPAQKVRATLWTEALGRSKWPGKPSKVTRPRLKALARFNAKLIDFARVNTTAGLEFVAELARAKGPTEALDLWSRYVQNHFQRLSDQSQELAKLGERIASSSAEPLTRSLHQTLRRAS